MSISDLFKKECKLAFHSNNTRQRVFWCNPFSLALYDFVPEGVKTPVQCFTLSGRCDVTQHNGRRVEI